MNYNFKDRIGERYGHLTVLERAEDAVFNSGKLVQWKCRCDCGKEIVAIGCNLAKMKSCGCQIHNRSLRCDLTGQRFGILTVISRAEDRVLPCGQTQKMWNCKCDCGSYVKVRSAHLRHGDTRSCGCIKSHGEREIAEYLEQHGIKFIREYEFEDCLNSNGNPVHFDFAIIKDNELVSCIEYQGEQHFYKPNDDRFFGYMQRTETDALKKEYCLTHNIPLYEIRYDENITEKLNYIFDAV